MDIIILGLIQALEFKPEVPTYAIRVIDGNLESRSAYSKLRKSKLYVQVRGYVFDDIAFDFEPICL